ncbi:MAG: FeoB-associated Cys-rich membrane protein [Lachnospiraceae bacterium]|nr:FeoB-associated Cys-rich membrane protein [Lachnospiraceae bacterium]MBP5183848.1 FeoB-associated Cys-rich membrane protein [Lachnospiraceae bacterium]
MMSFLAENIGTVIVAAVLVAVVALAVVSLVKGKKKGSCSCGGSCGSCGANCACHSK